MHSPCGPSVSLPRHDGAIVKRGAAVVASAAILAAIVAALPAAGCAGNPPARTRRDVPRESYVPPNSPPPLPDNRSIAPQPAAPPFPEPAHLGSPAPSVPAVHLIAQQPVALLGTTRAITAMLLDLKSGDPARATVRLTAADGESIDVEWIGGQELRAMNSRLYLQVWRGASVYVLP